MITTNIKMATASLRTSRIRSLLTMLGIVIGVTSVVMTVSIGEGVKNQVIGQINALGNNIITVRPGAPIVSKGNQISQINLYNTVATSTLTAADVASIKQIPGVVAVSPNSIITTSVSSVNNQNYSAAVVMATSLDTEKVLNQTVEYGEFFEQTDVTKNVAVIGSNVANTLYQQRDPIGRVLIIKGQEFIIRGVLSDAPENPLNLGPNYNNAVYIPYQAAEILTGNTLQISEINIKVASGLKLESISNAVRDTLYKNHNNQNDFTLVRQTEYLRFADQLFNLLTSFVAAVAAISLLVGGVGIMNVMLVSVSERTREIGVRKAIGATNQQILSQFLVEATVLSVLGGLLGVLLSLMLSFIIRVTTSIHPSVSIETIVVATGISTLVGIVFGMAPAVQAARKDPIVALRHE